MKYLLLAVVAAACSDKHPLPASDANGAPDEAVGEDAPAPVDALVPDAQDTRIKVKVALTGAPTPDIAVFYHRPDGSVAVTTQTDASGIAASELDPGGYVTVVFADELSRRIVRSYVDVPPGTVIEIGVRPRTPVMIKLPAAPSATHHYIANLCGDSYGLLPHNGTMVQGQLECLDSTWIVSGRNDRWASSSRRRPRRTACSI